MPPEIDDIASSLIMSNEAPAEKEAADEKAPVQGLEDGREDGVEEPEENESADEEVEEEEVEEEAEEEPEPDVDELEVEVQVEGETKSVKLKDLKAKYAGEGAIEKRLQDATKARQAMYAYSSELYKNLEEQTKRLGMLQEFLDTQAQPNINWEELRAKDPGKYLLERDRFHENEARKRQIEHQKSVLQEQQSKVLAQAMTERAKEEAQILLHSLPALKDPVKAKEVLEDFVNVGKEYGFSAQEIDGVVDHRAMLVLHDAIQYRKLMAKEKEAKATPKVAAQQLKQLMRPTGKSTATTAMDKNKRLHEALTKKAKATGKADDVAALLVVDRKKK